MYSVGDIISRTQSYDPYESIIFNNYVGISFMVMNVEKIVIKSTMKTVTHYKLLCIETGDILHATASSIKTWEKLA